MIKKLFIIMFVVLAPCMGFAIPEWYNATTYIGGSSSSLDSIDGQNLFDGDKSLVVKASGQTDIYNLDVDSALDEDTTNFSIVSPDSNAGDKRWVKVWSGGRVLIPDSTVDQGDSAITGTLAWHIDNASSNKTVVRALTGNYLMSTTTTAPSTMTLKFDMGAIIADDASDAVFTINGPIDAKIHQIFDWGTGSGALTFGAQIDRVYPEWFGADNTAAADSATAFNQSVTAITGGILDLNGRTFRVDSTVDLESNLTIEGYGGSIDFSNAATGDYLFEASGSAATAQDVLASVAQGDEVITVTDAGSYWSTGDWTWIADDDTFGVVCLMGEWVHVLSVDSNNVNLGSDLLYDYTTGDNAKLSVITFIENLYVKGVKATGAADTDWFLSVSYGKNINVSDCHISDFEHAGIALYYVIQFNVSNNKVFRSTQTGYGYGVLLAASANGSIEDNYLEECRHGATIGSNVFPTRYVTTKNNYVQSPTDAGLDSHQGSEFCIWDGNTVQGGETAGITADGIIVQGANATIINNKIIGVERHGILVENYIDNDSIPSSYTISGNYIERPGDGTDGDGIQVAIAATSTGPIKGLNITNNTIKDPSARGIFVYARTADIDSVVITGNIVTGVAGLAHPCIWLYALSGITMTGGVVSNNIVESDDDNSYTIYLQATVADEITYFSIMGNFVSNGAIGIVGANTDFLTVVGNTIVGTDSDEISIAAGTNEEDHNAFAAP